VAPSHEGLSLEFRPNLAQDRQNAPTHLGPLGDRQVGTHTDMRSHSRSDELCASSCVGPDSAGPQIPELGSNPTPKNEPDYKGSANKQEDGGQNGVADITERAMNPVQKVDDGHYMRGPFRRLTPFDRPRLLTPAAVVVPVTPSRPPRLCRTSTASDSDISLLRARAL